jgi:hypothetical protein
MRRSADKRRSTVTNFVLVYDVRHDGSKSSIHCIHIHVTTINRLIYEAMQSIVSAACEPHTITMDVTTLACGCLASRARCSTNNVQPSVITDSDLLALITCDLLGFMGS